MEKSELDGTNFKTRRGIKRRVSYFNRLVVQLFLLTSESVASVTEELSNSFIENMESGMQKWNGMEWKNGLGNMTIKK